MMSVYDVGADNPVFYDRDQGPTAPVPVIATECLLQHVLVFQAEPEALIEQHLIAVARFNVYHLCNNNSIHN